MYGRRTSETNYAGSLRERVTIAWNFDPKTDLKSRPVTRSDGHAFRILWQGGDPNQMIRAQLKLKGSNLVNASGTQKQPGP